MLTFFRGELISPLRRVKSPNPRGIVRGEGDIVYESNLSEVLEKGLTKTKLWGYGYGYG